LNDCQRIDENMILPDRESLMGTALLVVGILCLLVGLIWVGQGTGYFPYPASSFMIMEMTWAYRGAVVAVIGVVLIVISRLI
jgi:hypothetical protein